MLMLTWITICSWIPIFIVSLNHLFGFSDLLVISSFSCGVLFFLAMISSLICLVKKYVLEALLIGLLFFSLGWINGPFLEPPGDPMDHLAEAYSTCEQTSKNALKSNGGLWHYSMTGVILCSEDAPVRSPDKTLRKIRLTHSLMVAFLAVGLYAVGKSAGLPTFWSTLGVLITYLFMGTNRFSFFSYYSLADSSSSLLIYWMWIAAFFFTESKSYRHLFAAVSASLVLTPILYVNHIQEAIFLGLMCLIFLLIWFVRYIFQSKGRNIKWIMAGVGILLFFVCPQFEYFQDIISPFFMINDWEKNQNLVVYLGPIHLMGKIWSFRVNDTLGLMGTLTLPAAAAIIWLAKNESISYKVALVGILPFLVYCIPLIHYIWLSNCRWLPTHTRYYYRICYASLFGVTLSYVLYHFGKKLFYTKNKAGGYDIVRGGSGRKYYRFFKVLSLFTFILLSTIRSGPVYGKIDFLILDTNPWWPQWRPMLEDLAKRNPDKPVHTDGITRFVLKSVFDQSVLEKGEYRSKGRIDLGRLPSQEKYHILVNLKGFTPSWVPNETRHWHSQLGNTAGLYTYKGLRGKKIGEILENNQFPGIQVFE